MKKIIIGIVVLILVGLGFYLLKPQKPVQSTKTKFFSQDKILPTDTVVKITSDGFAPPEISIKSGMRVVWINESSQYAWPASNPHPMHTDYPEFDPKEPFINGEVWAFTFEKAGQWGYHDHISPGHTGLVRVSLK